MTNRTLATLLRARLEVLLVRHRLSPYKLEEEMGASHTWVARKLRKGRGFTLADLDRILAHLKEPADTLLQPVLLKGDREFLRAVRDSDDLTAEAARALFADYDGHMNRLGREDFASWLPIHGGISHDSDKHLTITKRGQDWLRTTRS